MKRFASVVRMADGKTSEFFGFLRSAIILWLVIRIFLFEEPRLDRIEKTLNLPAITTQPNTK